MNEAPVIGQLALPGWSVRITPMPGTLFQSAPAAAALNASSLGATNAPSLLAIIAYDSLFCLA